MANVLAEASEMNRRKGDAIGWLIVFLAFVVTLGTASGAAGSGAEADSGFVPLFNGKDLTGWECRPGAWEVRDGAIWCTGKGKTRNWLIWRRCRPADFELRLKFKYVSGNSGVQVRSREIKPFMVRGYQVEIASKDKMGLWHHSLSSAKHRSHLATAGQKVHILKDGSKKIEQVAPAEKIQAVCRDNEWNDLVVIARGPRLIQKINGVVFADLTDEDAEYAALSGLVALQDHGKGTIAAFKDIRMKPFSEPGSNAGVAPSEKQ